ncbi:hypothetical protein ABZ863_06805 [Saccharomonospora sp. NPDC046836]|uniref:hypothetical protein n=1 Tax=Saccharomonospora sp. NPDC046836 TaxID=3156921 RepID=UPI003410528D
MPTAPPSPLRWLVPVLVVVVSLTIGGGLLARELYHLPDDDGDAAAPAQGTSVRVPREEPGSAQVELTPDAAAHPESEPVRTVLQEHFDAINGRDYDQWTTTVVAARVQAQSRRTWLTNYRSTRDGGIRVYRIEAAPEGRLRVLVGFTSTQDIVDAPPDLPEHCIRWWLGLPLTRESGEWRVDTVPTDASPVRAPC